MRLFLFILFLPIIGLSQQNKKLDSESEIKRRIQHKINYGIAVATIDSFNHINYYDYGIENESNSKVSNKSVFEIVSISKTFTSTLFQKLADENIIQLNQEIRNYIPDTLPENIQKITFQELINHTSGLPRLAYNYWTSNWDNPYADFTIEKLMTDLMAIKLDTTKHWAYSNLGYALLGYVADNVKDSHQLSNLISSLHLENTHLYFNDTANFATPHNFGNIVEHWEFPSFNKYLGGVKSSSYDLMQYLIFQIKNNKSFSNNYSKKDDIINPNDTIFGRNGWLLFKRKNQEIIWHNGISGGFNGFIGYNIQTKSGIVILSNSQSSITDIGLHYLSKSFVLNKPKLPFINQIEKQIKNNSFESLVNDWQQCDTSKFDKSLANVYWLQCHYISKNNFEAALALNDILVSENKDDWEAIFYRAKIYQKAGDFKLAKTTFEQVNDLFPENDFVKNELKTLPNNGYK